MIEIKSSSKPADVRIFVNDELFIDQILPHTHCILYPEFKQPKKSITVMNLGREEFHCNNQRVSPKQIIIY
jgi:hypothetical protein